MKKFYAIAAAGLMAATASAAVGVQNMAPAQLATTEAPQLVRSTMHKAPVAKAPTIDDFYGMYRFYAASMFTQKGDYMEFIVSFTKGEGANDVIMRGLNVASNVDIVCTLDRDNATLTIPSPVKIGEYNWDGSGDPIYFWNGIPQEDGGMLDGGPAVMELKVTESGQFIMEYPGDRCICNWIPNKGGYLCVAYGWFEQMEPLTNDGWTSLGMADFTEGWISPVMIYSGEMTEDQKTYKVEVQQNNADKGIYRIMNPYGPNTPFASTNLSVGEHALIINATYPDCVYVQQYEEIVIGKTQAGVEVLAPYGFYAGFFDGLQAILPGTVGGMYVSAGFDPEDIIDEGENLSYMEDGVIYLAQEDCIFGCSGEYNGQDGRIPATSVMFSGWGDGVVATGSQLDLNSLGAVNEIDADVNAPKVYYNMQGMRIAAPEAGQMVIVRQGNKSQKVVVK